MKIKYKKLLIVRFLASITLPVSLISCENQDQIVKTINEKNNEKEIAPKKQDNDSNNNSDNNKNNIENTDSTVENRSNDNSSSTDVSSVVDTPENNSDQSLQDLISVLKAYKTSNPKLFDYDLLIAKENSVSSLSSSQLEEYKAKLVSALNKLKTWTKIDNILKSILSDFNSAQNSTKYQAFSSKYEDLKRKFSDLNLNTNDISLMNSISQQSLELKAEIETYNTKWTAKKNKLNEVINSVRTFISANSAVANEFNSLLSSITNIDNQNIEWLSTKTSELEAKLSSLSVNSANTEAVDQYLSYLNTTITPFIEKIKPFKSGISDIDKLNNAIVSKPKLMVSTTSEINDYLSKLKVIYGLIAPLWTEEIINLKKYALDNISTTQADGVSRYGITLNSLSINLDNSKLYLKTNVSASDLTSEIKDVQLDNSNVNNLLISYGITKGSLSTTVLKSMSFGSDQTAKNALDSINNANLDLKTMFEIRKYQFPDLFDQEINAKTQDEIDNLFKNKNISVANYFKYRIKAGSFNSDSGETKVTIDILYNKKVVKSVENVSFGSQIIKPNGLKNLNLQYSEILTKNEKEYYNNPTPSNTMNEFFGRYVAIYYIRDVLKRGSSAAYDQWYQTFSNINARLDPFNSYQEKIKVLNHFISGVFNYNKTEYPTVEVLNLDSRHIFVYTAATNSLTFKVKFTKRDESSFTTNVVVAANTYETLKLKADLNNFIKDNNDFNTLVTLKNSGISQSDFIASEGTADKLNQTFSYPKLYQYNIVVAETSDANNIKGTLKVSYKLQKDGRDLPTSVVSDKYTLSYFKPLTRLDIKPKNGKEWYTDEDFQGAGIVAPTGNLQAEVNKINSSNFVYRYTDGKRMVNSGEIIRQKAWDKMNFLFDFNTKVEVADENARNFESENYKDKGPRLPETVPAGSNALGTGQSNGLQLGKLLKDYFVYYYDVQPAGRHIRSQGVSAATNVGSIKFKLGFINKSDNNIRLKTSDYITFTNVQNDYKDFMIEDFLNTISYEQLGINTNSPLLSNTASAFTKLDERTKSNFLSFSPLNIYTLHHGVYVSREKIKVDKTMLSNDRLGELYITLKYEIDSNTFIHGKTWYKISGFRKSGNAGSGTSDETIIKELNKALNNNKYNYRQPLVTLVKPDEVVRDRNIELTLKDNFWEITNKKASWTFKKQYYEKLVVSTNKNPKIHMHLYGNTLYFDDDRLKRIAFDDQGIDFDIDWNDLNRTKTVTITQSTKQVHVTQQRKNLIIEYKIVAELTDEGIKFTMTLTNPDYGFASGELFKETRSVDLDNTYNDVKGTVINGREFYLDHFASRVNISYTNTVMDEHFSEYPTNILNYKKMAYTQENMPLPIYSQDNETDPSKYNPNQNVHWLTNQGYKFDTQYLLHSYWNTKLGTEITQRAFAMNFGTATMVGKVSPSDPNDGRVFVVTNNHVINDHSLQTDPQKAILEKKFQNIKPTIPGKNYGNNVDSGFSYWSGLYNIQTKAQIVWSGINQIGIEFRKEFDRQAKILRSLGYVQVNNKFVDMTIIILDAHELIKTAQSEGKYHTAEYYKNWLKLPSLPLNDFTKYLPPSEDRGEEKVQARFAFRNAFAGGFLGFPYGKQAGYIITRSKWGTETNTFDHQTPFMPTFYNSGNSGTGVIDASGSYASTINSGAPRKSLTSWLYENNGFNYWGLNNDGQNPFDLLNKNSLARNIMKLNAFSPNDFGLPWYFKPFTKK
ncbi:MGA_1079 family surface serine endopeptidase [Mycoplasma corogypsi]|uniref:MGA_1079 family surface serine endopeptidase n=1 Tax=Mycoplasma corogypsi TaxID=2106 RepID=UPI003872DAE6